MSVAFEAVQVKYAERTTRRSKVFHRFEEHGLPDAELLMDYNYWIVRNEEHTILIDTGYDVSKGTWLGESSTTPVPETLAGLGVDPADVDIVVLSHYHFDHIGFVALFQNATVYAGRAEHEHWMGELASGVPLESQFVDPRHLAVLSTVKTEGRLVLVSGPTAIVPSLSVQVVSGHCPGQLLTIVHTDSGPLILASDVAHYYEQIEHGWIFFVHSDIDEMHRSFRTIRELADREGAEVIPGHDPRVRERFPALDGPAGRFANRLG